MFDLYYPIRVEPFPLIPETFGERKPIRLGDS